ncbi:LOW QUALITY PROTEIN: uncharacterized protein lmtk3 [Diretmus argenteus]
MTSSSADCLTPSDSWMGSVGSGGWRPLGNETPHRDSAYFSDSDWEGDSLNRRSSDGLGGSRPGSGRGGDRGTLTGIEEKTEVEEEGEIGEKSPLKEGIKISDSKAEIGERKTVEMSKEKRVPDQNALENDISHIGNDKDISEGLESTQREDSGIFHNDSRETAGNGLVKSNDSQAKGNVNIIDELFSNLEDEPLKGLLHSDGHKIDNHYTDGIISHVQITDSAENDLKLHPMNISETDSLIESVSGSQSKDCILRPNNKEYTSITPTDNDISELNAPHSGNNTVEPMAPSQFDNESRLSRFYGIQTSDTTLSDDTQSVLEPNDGKCIDDKVNSLTCSWEEGCVQGPESHEERPGLELQHTDRNELGLRNLCCSENGEHKNAKATSETEKQLAAGELSNAMKEKSPQREAARKDWKGVDSANSMDKESSEGLDLKTKELWNTLEEEDERTGGVVRGEFDCHRFTQRDLHLWPAENDQWASPENRRLDIELGSEFFSGFSNKAWEVGERLVVGREFWETEENDELAGSETHPTVSEACEETGNDETQGQADHLGLKAKLDSKDIAIQQAVPALDVQQEENIENLEEIDDCNRDVKGAVSDIEVENIEIPEQENLEQEKKQITPSTETVKNNEGQLDFAQEENQNFNRWTQNHLCEIQKEEQSSAEDVGSNLENYATHTLENISSEISICITEAPHVDFSGLENEPTMDSEPEMSPQLAGQDIEQRISIMNVEEDYRDTSLPSNPLSCPSDIGLTMQEEMDQSYPQVDNFSSVDFPSPPPSIDLDVQDDKLENFDDSFPSPPPSVVEAEEFISHMNLEDFIASTEPELLCISPSPNTDAPSEPPLQELPPATTQSKGISANLNHSPVHITLERESNLTSNLRNQNDQKNATLSPPQNSLDTLPELMISEWKDLDEEPLEDFEKLEQLCCISGDEEDTLGDLFLGNLELLESLKKTPEQKPSSAAEGDKVEETCGPSTSEGSRVELKENLDGVSDNSDKAAKTATCVIQDSQVKLSPQEERRDIQSPLCFSLCHTSDVKEQGSLSKMPTKNGLMMQVCEERLQFSLSENVQTNVLWGSIVKDTVTLRPWGEQITDGSGETLSVKDKNEDESQAEQESAPSPWPCSESDETTAEPLTVIEQPEVTSPQPTGNQAMKAKLARLSLALPPLALTLPLTPSGKVGFGEGGIGSRLGRRRGLSSGSDPEEEEEEEQEEEISRRVIVVTETDVDKRVGLRSLLKSPKEPMDREKDRGRNVSFFDDVTVYLFDQETPTNELSSSAPTSPAPVSGKSTKFDLHGANNKGKDSKRKEDLSIKPRSPVGANPVTSSRFTVSPADDPHLV